MSHARSAVHVAERRVHAVCDDGGRVDPLAPAIHAAEPDEPVVGELSQHREIAGRGDGELEHVLRDGETGQERHDGVEAGRAE